MGVKKMKTKKFGKKVTLKKETIANLENKAMNGINGGALQPSAEGGCETEWAGCTAYYNCGTVVYGCTNAPGTCVCPPDTVFC